MSFGNNFTFPTTLANKIISFFSVIADFSLPYDQKGTLKEYQVKVALLSRNIVVQGDALNSEPTDKRDVCNITQTNPESAHIDSSTFPCPDAYLTGFGAHVMVMEMPLRDVSLVLRCTGLVKPTCLLVTQFTST